MFQTSFILFLKKANERHNHKYDYSKAKYIDKETPICIVCPIHGEFWQTPVNHLRTYGCQKCSLEKRVKIRTMTQDQFIEKARKIHGDKYDYSKVEYKGSQEKVRIICPIHGEFEQVANYHLSGNGCPKCGRIKANRNESLNIQEFIRRAREVHGNKYDYSKVEYVNNRTKVCIICPIHGEFWQTPNSHLRGRGCPKCGIQERIKIFKSNNEEFIEKARKIHGDKYDYSKVNYINNHTKVCIICPEHGEFHMKPNTHLNGQGCPKCGKIQSGDKMRKSTDEFIIEAQKIHRDKYDYSKVEYKNAHTKVCIICPEHGEFWQKPCTHLQGCGCPVCKTSKLELKMIDFLSNNNIKFIYHANKCNFEWLNKQSIDFYLPEYNIAIECQGKQHFNCGNFGSKNFNFNRIYENDCKKNRLCREHNIKLIYYTEYKNYHNFDLYNDKNTYINLINMLRNII